MSYNWNGPAGKGARARRKAQKRAEAEERQSRVKPENIRQYRLKMQAEKSK